MGRTTVKIVGQLRFTDEDGLQYSIPLPLVGNKQQTSWLEALPNFDNWPTLGKSPQPPERPKLAPRIHPESNDEYRNRIASHKAAQEEWKAAEERWKQTAKDYMRSLHADPTYRAAAKDFLAKQQQEPEFLQVFGPITIWAFREKVVSLESTDPEIVFRKETGIRQITDKAILLIKHHVLSRERHFEKMKREVEALENMEKLSRIQRQPIPDSVRLFVWQRDNGRCVKCGSRERLEFDHIIPVAAGGSNTERNVQLLCETCNRSKGSAI
jgi:HNH endonuclease